MAQWCFRSFGFHLESRHPQLIEGQLHCHPELVEGRHGLFLRLGDLKRLIDPLKYNDQGICRI